MGNNEDSDYSNEDSDYSNEDNDDIINKGVVKLIILTIKIININELITNL